MAEVDLKLGEIEFTGDLTTAAYDFAVDVYSLGSFSRRVAVSLRDGFVQMFTPPEGSEPVPDPSEQDPRAVRWELPEDTYLKFGSLSRDGQILFQAFYSRLVDGFLIYAADLLTLIFLARRETFRSDAKFSVEFILQHENMEDLVASMVERRVLDLSYEGIRNLNQYVSRQLGFALFETTADVEEAERIVEIRNLFTHHRGRVTSRFLDRIPTMSVKAGETLEVGAGQFAQDMDFLLRTTRSIDKRAIAKFGLATRPAPELVDDGTWVLLRTDSKRFVFTAKGVLVDGDLRGRQRADDLKRPG